MKVTIQVPKEIEVTHILIDVPVEYGDEDIPYDFPLRVKLPQTHPRLTADRWVADVNIDTGKIAGWPADAGPRQPQFITGQSLPTRLQPQLSAQVIDLVRMQGRQVFHQLGG